MSKHMLQWTPPSTLKVSGVVDEDVQFEPSVERFGTQATVDFSGVTRINSCGVRQWTKAIAGCPALIRYVDAPTLIVDQFSMVPEFLGPRSTVESFEARYVCNACSFEENVKLVVGRHVQKGSADAPEHPCGRCGQPSEMDHNPEVFLEFLMHIC